MAEHQDQAASSRPSNNEAAQTNSLNHPMSPSDFLTAAHSSLDHILQYYTLLPSVKPLSQVSPGYLRPLLPSSAPEQGEPWSAIQSDIKALIEPGLTHWQSPNFMAFFPASSTFPGMLGELYSAAFTAPAFNWQCSPATTELETIVLDWMAKLFGLSEDFLSHGEGGGVIQGTASEAVITCLVAAREKALEHHTSHLEGEEKESKRFEIMARLVALGSEQAHSSVAKGARIAGIRYRSIHAPTSDNYSLTHSTVSQALQQCEAEGLIPFFLCLTLGTTSTCSIDNFSSLASLLTPLRDTLWTHIDAAYAGAALILPAYQHLSQSFSAYATSIDINMHKWLLTNFDASTLFIRRRRLLTDALSITPAYLRNENSDKGLVTDYRDWQIPLGRRFRALKIWFVIRIYGVAGMREHIQRHISMGEEFGRWLRERRDFFEIIAGPAFALNCFAIIPPGRIPSQAENGSAGEGKTSKLETEGILPTRAVTTSAAETADFAEANALTKEVYETINARGKIFLTSTVVNGRYAIRVVSANPLADAEHLRAAFDEILEVVESVRSGWRWDGKKT